MTIFHSGKHGHEVETDLFSGKVLEAVYQEPRRVVFSFEDGSSIIVAIPEGSEYMLMVSAYEKLLQE